jgi:ribosomal-protein-alanine N-acetyltransferase
MTIVDCRKGPEQARGSYAGVVKSLRLRRFAVRDLPSLLRIERASFGAGAWPPEVFREYARFCREGFLVAELRNHMVGYCIVNFGAASATLDSIAVSPLHRGRGIARWLLAACVKSARRRGLRRISLMVRKDNTAAIRLYRRFGFVRTATVRDYYEDGAAAWRMSRALDRPADPTTLPGRIREHPSRSRPGRS